MSDIRKLRYIFDRRQKIKILLLGLMIVIGSLFELLGVTAILPFIEVAVDPRSIEKNGMLSYFYNLFNMQSPSLFLAYIAMALIVIYIIKNLYLAVLNYGIYRFTYNNQRQLSVRLLKGYMRQPYVFFVNKNSADLMRNVSDDTSGLFDTVLSFMQLMVEAIVCSLLFVFLLIKDKTITIAVGLLVIVALGIIIRALKKDLHKRGEYVRICRGNMGKWLLQSFGGIKETIISEKQDFFVRKYDRIYRDFAQNHCLYQTYAYLPKPLMETFCIGGILAVVAFKLFRGVGSAYLVSTMSLFAVAAFRLLPAFNRITGYLSRIMFNHSAVSSVYNDLKEIEKLEKETENTVDEVGSLVFKKEIEIRDVSFRYPNTERDVVSGINLTIPRNKSVAFIGASGAGKTTLADIVLGVLKPGKGGIYVDGIDIERHMSLWHNKIGYIPQTIYLMDDSIKNNIAYAMDESEIDDNRINEVMQEAQLSRFVSTLEHGADTIIGEKGVRLSGGQRQRIGIARALYSNPDILILDEATSALDNDTEAAVMEAIDSLAGKKTLIIIAHRLSTISNCDVIYEISEHGIIERDHEYIMESNKEEESKA